MTWFAQRRFLQVRRYRQARVLLPVRVAQQVDRAVPEQAERRREVRELVLAQVVLPPPVLPCCLPSQVLPGRFALQWRARSTAERRLYGRLALPHPRALVVLRNSLRRRLVREAAPRSVSDQWG